MRVLVDATTLIALGSVGELDLLAELDGAIAVPPVVPDEVTTEPAATNLDRFCEEHAVATDPIEPYGAVRRAAEVLDEPPAVGDVRLVAGVLADTDRDDPVGVVSDDRRVRTVSRGLGVTVTGTVGLLVRGVRERGLSVEEGRKLVERVDSHGLHMTGELREKAYQLVVHT
jgi:predicted nucleic acid-binding protein